MFYSVKSANLQRDIYVSKEVALKSNKRCNGLQNHDCKTANR